MEKNILDLHFTYPGTSGDAYVFYQQCGLIKMLGNQTADGRNLQVYNLFATPNAPLQFKNNLLTETDLGLALAL